MSHSYTIVGMTDGQVRVNWVDADSITEAIRQELSSVEWEKWENNERDTPPLDEIISIFEGHHRDRIGEFNDSPYPLSRQQAYELLQEEPHPHE